MTNHFTQEEAVALAKQSQGPKSNGVITAYWLDMDFAALTRLCNAAVDAKLAKAVAHGDVVRYCRECGSIGEVPKGKRDCCPDGTRATYVHPAIAEQAKGGFHAALPTHPQASDSVFPPLPHSVLRCGQTVVYDALQMHQYAMRFAATGERHE